MQANLQTESVGDLAEAQPAVAPGPPPRPSLSVLAQTIGFITDPLRLLDDAARECGETFSLRILGKGEWVFLTSPGTIKKMFGAPPDVLAAGRIRSLMLGEFLGFDSTFTLDGPAHRRRQKLVFSLFNGPRILRFIATIRRVTEARIAQWPVGQVFPVLPENHRIALEVIFRAVLAGCDSGKAEELLELFEEYTDSGARSLCARFPVLQVNLGRYSPWGRFLHLRQLTRDAFRAEIRARKARGDAEGAGTDVLGFLINARQDDGTQLTEESLLDEILTLLFAGHETTGLALTWILDLLLSHPEAEARLRYELESVLGDEPITRHHLHRLPYLDAVINESFRCRPIAPMAAVRTALKPFRVGDYVVGPGTTVAGGLYILGNRPELFPQPDRFNPVRFIESRPQNHDWTPFGGGKRLCSGKGLAHLELTCATATIFQRTKLRLRRSDTRTILDGHMFAPKDGLEVVMDERRQLPGEGLQSPIEDH